MMMASSSLSEFPPSAQNPLWVCFCLLEVSVIDMKVWAVSAMKTPFLSQLGRWGPNEHQKPSVQPTKLSSKTILNVNLSAFQVNSGHTLFHAVLARSVVCDCVGPGAQVIVLNEKVSGDRGNTHGALTNSSSCV